MAPNHLPSRRGLIAAAVGAGVTLLAGSASALSPAVKSAWPGGRKGAVSLTYDDGLNSQLDHALPELNRRGLKATFFLTRENMEGRLSDWEAVGRAGHEIADHTVTHPCDLRHESAGLFQRRELAPMERWLDDHFGRHRAHTYAYPCGYLGLGAGSRQTRYARYQQLMRHDFLAARTTSGGPNLAQTALADRFHLHAFEPTYDGDVVAPAARYLKATVDAGGWAILVFHDVLPKWHGEGDSSTRTHARILDMVQAHDLWTAPMGQVMHRLEHVAGGRRG